MFHIHWKALTGTLALIMLGATIHAVSAAGIFQDGDFALAPNPGAYTTYKRGSAAIPGWVVTKATIDLIGTYWLAPGRRRSIDLDGTPGFGAVAQTFATIPGKRYVVSFLLSGNSDGAPTVKSMRVSAAAASADFRFDSAAGSAQHGNWLPKTMSFVATHPATTLQFRSLDTTGGICGPVIARIAVVRE